MASPVAPNDEKSAIDERYDDKFNHVEELRQLEQLQALRDNHPDAIAARKDLNSRANDDIQSQEESPTLSGPWTDKTTPQNTPSQQRSIADRAKAFVTNKKKMSITTIAAISILLFGGGAFLSLTTAPIAFLANVGLDLNDPLSAVEDRTQNQMEKKFLNTKSGTDKVSLGCASFAGVSLPIKCKYKRVSPWLEDKLKSVGVEIEGTKAIGGGILPERYIYTDSNGQKITYDTPEKFTEAIKGGNPELWRDYRRALNMNWLSMKGKTFVNKVLAKFGLDQSAKKLTGTADERTEQLANGKEATPLNEASFKQIADAEDGSERWQDDNGNIYTTNDKNKILEGSPSFKENIKPLGQVSIGALEKVNAGVNVLGYFDAACSVRNMIGAGTIAAKVSNAAQLAAYFMQIAPLVGKLQSLDDIEPEDAEAIQRFFNDTDARKTVAGFTASDSGGDKTSVSEITNPNYGKNAMDSELYKMSVGGGVASTSISELNYTLGFGTDSFFKSSAANILNVGNFLSDIKGIDTCDYIQSKAVRTAGLLVGGGMMLASAFGCAASFGLLCPGTGLLIAKTAGTITAFTIATVMISRYLNAALSDSLISDTMNQAPVDRGSALWTGMSVLYSTSSQMRGMMPGSADQIIAYQSEQNVARQEYIALERESSNPLDIKNPYSLTGTIAANMSQHFSDATPATIATSLASFTLGGLASSIRPYSAYAASLNSERYKQCDDAAYKDVGIDADVQCNVRYIMPTESMQLDSLDVAQWMEDNHFVEKDTTTGYPKGYSPPEPSKIQKGAMDVIKGTTKDLTKGFVEGIYGVGDASYEKKYNEPYQAEGLKGAKYAKFLDYCVYRALPYGNTYEEGGALGDIEKKWLDGSACRDTTEDPDINYFRMYVFDLSVNDDLEGPVVGGPSCGPSTSGGATGTKISETDLKQLISSAGLPEPQKEASRGVDNVYGSPVQGYEALQQQLSGDQKASWATQALLNGEKKWKAAGGDIKEYLNTAWIWFETGQGAWPDPYEMNCQNNTEGTFATKVCSSTDFQAAGYQPNDARGRFKEVFDKLYKEENLPSIMKSVVENSSKASKDIWNYSDPSNSSNADYFNNLDSIAMNDLWPTTPYGDAKAQIQSLILGKDPAMVAGLNSYAVSDDDLIKALHGDGYGYIKEEHKQLLSNMIYALYLFDGSGPTGSEDCVDIRDLHEKAGGQGISAIFNGTVPGITQEFGPTDFAREPENYDMYDYQLEYGIPASEFGHTGIDYDVALDTKIYSPVDGTVITAGGTQFFQSTDRVEKNGLSSAGTGELKIQLDNGDQVILGHMHKIEVEVGSRVTVGQYVGLSGTENGPHLHLEYRIPDSPDLPNYPTLSGMRIVDPRDYL